jgi:hypothetical protein
MNQAAPILHSCNKEIEHDRQTVVHTCPITDRLSYLGFTSERINLA